MSAVRSERWRALERLLPSIVLGVSVALLLVAGMRQKGAAVRQESLNEAILNQISMRAQLEHLKERLAELEAALRALRRSDVARPAAPIVSNMPDLDDPDIAPPPRRQVSGGSASIHRSSDIPDALRGAPAPGTYR